MPISRKDRHVNLEMASKNASPEHAIFDIKTTRSHMSSALVAPPLQNSGSITDWIECVIQPMAWNGTT